MEGGGGTLCIDKFQEFRQEIRRYPAKPYIEPAPLKPQPLYQIPKQEKKKKKKKFFKRNKEEAANPSTLPSTNDNIPSNDAYDMDSFFIEVPEIRKKIKKLSKLMDEYDQVYYQALNAIDEHEANKLQILMENVMQVINRNAQEAKASLDKIKETNDKIKMIPNYESTGDYRMRELQYSDLSCELTRNIGRLQGLDREHKRKSYQQIERQYKLVRTDATEEELEALTDATGAMTLTSNQVFQLGSSTDATRMLQEMRIRREAIVNLEKSISVLAKMFQEMSMLIEEQEEVLGKIETNTGKLVEYMEEAQKEMSTAVEHQKNIRKLKCSIF